MPNWWPPGEGDSCGPAAEIVIVYMECSAETQITEELLCFSYVMGALWYLLPISKGCVMCVLCTAFFLYASGPSICILSLSSLFIAK